MNETLIKPSAYNMVIKISIIAIEENI